MSTLCERAIMVVDENFVRAYSRLFDFLVRQGGAEEVTRFCELLSDCIAKELTDRIRLRGLAGAFEYWSDSLPAEGATCKITLDVKEGLQTLQIVMLDCPSLRCLDKPNNLYCKHCDTIYRRILERLGYDFYINYNGYGQCRLMMSERER